MSEALDFCGADWSRPDHYRI